ncbi:MAG TPA: hypothetical protein VGF81_14040 [Solirubrobacteraceae bacterium]|jgi:hypothetical protein
MREVRSTATVDTSSWTIPEQIDDGCVRYAVEGAVVCSALALARALVDEELRPGDARCDRLVAIQRELIELRENWS